jgi:Tol biopolymer transport system component
MIRTIWNSTASTTALAILTLLIGTAQIASADCSVIAPEGFDSQGLIGSATSPFLTPGLTNDIKVVGAICDQSDDSAAADFQVGGADLPVDQFVITIAFIGASAPPLLVLADDGNACGTDVNCSVNTLTDREIAEIPLPGGSTERRLRFRVPDDLSHFGPVRLGVKLASDPQPLASELRSVSCSDASGDYVACIDQFFVLDGSCRKGDAYINRPFSGLVAIPKTDFTSICTTGCEDVSLAPTSSTLPVTIDRDGNAIFAMIYADQLVREDNGFGLIEPRPRRLSLSIADAVANGFSDDSPSPFEYKGKPSSFTFEGFPLSPPFNPFVDPTASPGDIGIWGMADAEATVHFLPRQACSDDPARACSADSDCESAATCTAAEFTFIQDPQDGSAIALPVRSAEANQAVELNSWLDGGLSDAAVAIAEDERLRDQAVNADGAADDIVVELLDRGTGLIKRLRTLVDETFFDGIGLTQVRVAKGDRDFVVPAMVAEDRTLAFLESEFAEGLANPLDQTTRGEALAADANGNSRLDQNLRVFALADDPAVEEARSLLPAGLDLAVLADHRFEGGRNLVLSEGNLYFAYSPIANQAHNYQLVNQSSEGVAGESFSGQADLSSDGGSLVFVSGAANLFIPAPPGELSAETSGGTVLQAVTGPDGEFPVIVDGKAVFEYIATDDAKGPAPSEAYLELLLCDTTAPALEPDLIALANETESGPNATIEETSNNCSACGFPDSWMVEFNRGLGKGGSQTYRLVFDSPLIAAGEIGVSFKSGGKVERTAIRGPACKDPSITPGIERVYLRDLETGTTEIVSVQDRTSCDDPAMAVDEPSGNPDVTLAGQFVFFDSTAGLTSDDVDDGEADIFAYDSATCVITNLSAGLDEPSSNPTSSDDGTIVAYQSGGDLMLLDRSGSGVPINLGSGQDPDLSGDGTKLVYTDVVAGVTQVFLIDLSPGASTTPIAVSVIDGDLFALGAGAPSVANAGETSFETPPGDVDSELFVRDVVGTVTIAASTLPTGENVCSSSPCGTFSPSISDDGRFVAYVVRGLGSIDEILIKDLVTGSITPLTQMAGADADSFEPSLGMSGDFVALTSFASQLAGVAGGGEPNVFLEGPADPTAERGAMLGVLDITACIADSDQCMPILTDEPVTKGAVFAGDIAVVGSPVRVIQTSAGPSGISVSDYVREGSDVALSAGWVCALAETDAAGNAGSFAACANRSDSSLSDLIVQGGPLAAEKIGLCGDRAVALGSDGVLYEADLAFGFEALAVQRAQDFELGNGLDTDADGEVDSCLVAFRTPEVDLGAASEVGNRDLDNDDLAMFIMGADGVVTDCHSSTTDCPGQACEQFNYQVGRESVVFLVNEADENFGFTPEQDLCSPGTDVNEDGLCDESVRRCTAAGSLTEGTSFGAAGNIFALGRFPDGENTVTEAGFCGTDFASVRFGQLCTDDLDCLDLPGETCHRGFVVLSALADTDHDEIPDVFDNCPLIFNPDQTNTDQDDPLLVPDRFGDACDAFTCGDGDLQSAETCDEGPLNGTPGSSCTAECTCGVQFEVIETLKPGSNGNTPIVISGSAAADGSGCLNLDTKTVGDVAPKSIDATTLRLSATPPTESCPTSGGAPIHDMSRRYKSHLDDVDLDGIMDLRVHIDTPPIGGDSSTTMVYLTGRFSEDFGAEGGSCFVSTAPVQVSGN